MLAVTSANLPRSRELGIADIKENGTRLKVWGKLLHVFYRGHGVEPLVGSRKVVGYGRVQWLVRGGPR